VPQGAFVSAAAKADAAPSVCFRRKDRDMASVTLLEDHIALSHDDAAGRHEWAAPYWAERGVDPLAALERRHARSERDAAERERMRLVDTGAAAA
jgi:hypothetical protein